MVVLSADNITSSGRMAPSFFHIIQSALAAEHVRLTASDSWTWEGDAVIIGLLTGSVNKVHQKIRSQLFEFDLSPLLNISYHTIYDHTSQH